MKIVFKVLIVLVLSFFFNTMDAQEIRGFVYTDTNEPVGDVSIYYKTKKLTKTNAEGVFILSKVYELPIKLRLEHPNYYISEVEIKLNNESYKLNPLLKSDNLEEIKLSTTFKNYIPPHSTIGLIVPTEKITSEKLDSYSPINIVSALNEIPGIYIQNGALNTNRITIRGIGSRTLYGTNKIRAYFNGIPITNGVGETAIDVFDSENLQSIDIIKGPKAVLYGSNLGGVLLFKSKQVAAGQSILKNNLTFGSFGLLKNSVSAATSTENLSLSLTYDYLKTDGYRENSNYDRKSLLLTSTYKINSNNEISLLMNYIDYFAQIPSSLGKTAFEEDPSQASYTWKEAQGYEKNEQILNGFSFTHHFSENFSNESTLFYTYLDHYEPRPFNILDEFTNGFGARSVFTKNFVFLKHNSSLKLGGEFYKDQYNWKTVENLYKDTNGKGSLEGEMLSNNIEKRNNLNFFATLKLPFTKNLTGQFGLNFNKRNYNFIDAFNEGDLNRSNNRNFDPILAPNINMLYKLSDNLSIFFNFGRGFNYPSLEETLTPEGDINPELGPEIGFNYELGSELFFLKRKLYLQINAYLMDIDDLLVAERVGDDEYIGRNAGKTEHKGLEIQLTYRQPIFKNGYISPYLNIELTNHKFIDFIDGAKSFSGNRLTGVPNQKVNGGIDFRIKALTLHTNFLYVGEMPVNDSNELYSERFTVFNAKASYEKMISSLLSLQLNTGINNIMNTRYASSILINATGFGNSEPRYYYPGMPRNWFGSIKLMYTL